MIKKKIIEMLTQNTGIALCDSGGAYGRHWQENQKVNDWNIKDKVTHKKCKGNIIFEVE